MMTRFQREGRKKRMDKERISYLALSKNGFLFDSASGHTYSLNPTGTFILKRLIEGKSTKKIVSAMVANYEASEENISQDFDQFLHYITELGLIEKR